MRHEQLQMARRESELEGLVLELRQESFYCNQLYKVGSATRCMLQNGTGVGAPMADGKLAPALRPVTEPRSCLRDM